MIRRPMCLLCFLMMLVLGIADLAGIPLIRGNPLPASVQSWIKAHPGSEIYGEVERYENTEFSQSVYLKKTYLIYHSKKFPINNVRVFLKKEEELKPGMQIFVKGILKEVEGPTNPGGFDSSQYYACRHIYYFMKKAVLLKKTSTYSGYHQAMLMVKEKCRQILENTAGKDAPVFEAIVLGEKTGLDPEIRMRYQLAGIVHILAISGLHISILGMGLYKLIKRVGFGIWPAGIFSLAVMLQYGMMTGGTVSTMRAVCMFLLSVGAKIAGRIYDMPTGMAAAAILILMENPAYLLDGGFLLSFGSVIGIGCVWPMVQEGMDVLNRKKRSKVNEKGKIRNKLLMSFLASGVVQLTTLPIVLWFYGEVSVMGIFLNLLVLPTVGIVLGSGTAGALLGLVTVRGAFLAVVPGRIILRGYEFLTVLLGRLSFCTWIGGKPEVWQIVGYYLVLAAAVWIYRAGVKKSENGKIFAWKIRAVYACMVCFAILLISYRPHEDFRIACLDVGQGDGIVVEIENRWNILIDGGSTNKNELGKYQLLPYLKSRGISRLDGIYVSHTDEDHISGVRELLEFVEKDLTSLRIENLILPKWSDIQENKNYRELTELAESAGVRVLTVKAGDEIRYGTVRLKVLWPESTASGKEVNEDAMVLEMISKDFKGLFTGDIGMETEEKLIQNGCLEDVDFLKTAHHGSRYSTGAEFLEIVRPELAVVSCSATNTYGHPSPDTLERLKKSGSRVLITRDCGAVTIVNGKSVSAFNRIK